MLNWIFGKPEEINGGERCPTYLFRWTILKGRDWAAYLHHFVGDDWSPRSSDANALYPVLVHRLAHLLHASFRPRLATAALAFSLALHLHQVGQRTFTSKLLSMPSTQLIADFIRAELAVRPAGLVPAACAEKFLMLEWISLRA